MGWRCNVLRLAEVARSSAITLFQKWNIFDTLGLPSDDPFHKMEPLEVAVLPLKISLKRIPNTWIGFDRSLFPFLPQETEGESCLAETRTDLENTCIHGYPLAVHRPGFALNSAVYLLSGLCEEITIINLRGTPFRSAAFNDRRRFYLARVSRI